MLSILEGLSYDRGGINNAAGERQTSDEVLQEEQKTTSQQITRRN